MSVSHIPTTVRRQVETPARHCCEYCLLPDGVSFFPHEIDHIIAEKHGGETTLENLALACWRYNRYKGTDLGSFDPQTGDFVFLFNPRAQQWTAHFRWQETLLDPLTPEGRTSVFLLRFNLPDRQDERKRLIERSHYPPFEL
ncbi:MAG: HNH endonuclease [Anaerolineales bacterium]|nr:HNH endonuclease [Anaerolineales bacterium]